MGQSVVAPPNPSPLVTGVHVRVRHYWPGVVGWLLLGLALPGAATPADRAAHTYLTDGLRGKYITFHADSRSLPRTEFAPGDLPPWGVCISPDAGALLTSPVLAQLKAANLRTIRLEAHWAALQLDGPDSFTPDATGFASELDGLAAGHFTPIVYVDDAPNWCNGMRGKAYPPLRSVENELVHIRNGRARLAQVTATSPALTLARDVLPIVIAPNPLITHHHDEIATTDYHRYDQPRVLHPPILVKSAQVWVDENDGHGFVEWKRVDNLIGSPDGASDFEIDRSGRIKFRAEAEYAHHGRTPGEYMDAGQIKRHSGVRIRVSYDSLQQVYREGRDYTLSPTTGVLTARAPALRNSSVRAFYDVLDPAPYADFMKRLVTRFSTDVKVWEIWTEPDQTWTWQGGPAAYAALVRVASRAIRAADPMARVVAGGYSTGRSAALASLYAGGDKALIDAPSWHALLFSNRAPDVDADPFMQSNLAGHAAMTRAHDSRDALLDETGAGSGLLECGGGMSPDRQAEFALRMMMLSRRLGYIRSFEWWPVMDLYPTGTHEDDPFGAHGGLFALDGSPKPALYALWAGATNHGILLDLASHSPTGQRVPASGIFPIRQIRIGVAKRENLSSVRVTSSTFAGLAGSWPEITIVRPAPADHGPGDLIADLSRPVKSRYLAFSFVLAPGAHDFGIDEIQVIDDRGKNAAMHKLYLADGYQNTLSTPPALHP